MVVDGQTIIREPGPHTHVADPSETEAHGIQSKIRNAARISREPTSTLVSRHLVGVRVEVMGKLPKRQDMQDNVRSIRRTSCSVPIVPKTANFPIPEEFCQMVLHDSGVNDPSRFLVLGHKDLLEVVGQADMFLCDGTFAIVPEVFYQLYTIHCKVGTNYPPCIYFLLQGKSQPLYEKMLQALKMLVPNANPSTVITDLELAAMNAFRSEFPAARLTTCFFHLTQAVVRKVQKLGLTGEFQRNPEFNVLVKSLPALSFVPLTDLDATYDELANHMILQYGHLPAVRQLLSYFQRTYVRGEQIGNQRIDPMFPPEIWNHSLDSLDSIPRTTNAVEGYHNSLQSIFLCKKPSVWRLLEGLEIDIASQLHIVSSADSGKFGYVSKKYQDLNMRLAAKVAQFDQQLNKIRFLRSIVTMQISP
jgi:hypothetical protein